jgi:2-dehydro-3-deoxyphosphogluconate aldolase/(4S)-4-hydroxy-2-oxoglutarate aldolase
MNTSLVERLRALKIVPIMTIDDPDKAVPLADAILTGGLPCAEVTFRTSTAVESLRRIASERPDLLAGAGTVLTTQQAAQAKEAGARFVLAPGLNPRVVQWCQDHDLPIFPGVCTPSDIERALELGLSAVKFFPMEQIGGLPYLKAIAAPFPGLEFMPTGGITADNVRIYLAFPRVIACGGSWMTPSDWIAASDFDRVRDAVRRAVEIAGAPSKGR